MIDKGISYDNIPQLAKPKKGNQRQGYRGDDAYGGGYGGGYSGGSSGGGSTGGGSTGGGGGSDNNHSRFDVGSGYYGETKTTSSAPPSGNKDDTREQYAVTRTITPIDEEVEVGPISEPERDTGLERQRLKNIALVENLKNTTYEDLDRKLLPPTNPFNIGVNILGGFIGKTGFEKNRDFFVENVAGKYGYGYGLEDYEQYMEDRMSGKVSAYGNPALGQNAINERAGDDDRSDTSGILEALLIADPDSPLLSTSPTGFTYVPYSNQVVVAPGSQGLASLTGGQGFLSSII